MNAENGATTSKTDAHLIEQQFEALKANLKKLVKAMDTTSEGYLNRAKQQIKAHPIAAVGLAFGIGYLVVRLVRRRG